MGKQKRRGRNEGMIRFIKDKKIYEGRYAAGVKEDGSTLYKSIYNKKRSVVAAKMRDALTALGKGEYVDPSDKSLYAWCKEYYEVYKEPTIERENTQKKYEESLARVEKADIAPVKLKDFKGPEQIQKYYNNLKKQGLDAETIKITHTLINGAFEKAEELNMILKNPAKGVVIPKTEDYDKEDGEDVKALTNEEYDLFMGELYRRSHYFMYAHFMSNTGLRPGEAIALLRSDLDFKNNLVKVTKTALRNKKGEPRKNQNATKTYTSKRTVPVPASTMKLMKEYMLKQKNQDDKAPLFQTLLGTRLHDRNALRAFKDIGKDVGCEWVNLHTMRHTFASRLFKEGVDIKVISKLLGHKKVSTTYDIYIHFINNVVEDSIQVLNSDVAIPDALPEKTKRKTKIKGNIIKLKEASTT